MDVLDGTCVFCENNKVISYRQAEFCLVEVSAIFKDIFSLSEFKKIRGSIEVCPICIQNLILIGRNQKNVDRVKFKDYTGRKCNLCSSDKNLVKIKDDWKNVFNIVVEKSSSKRARNYMLCTSCVHGHEIARMYRTKLLTQFPEIEKELNESPADRALRKLLKNGANRLDYLTKTLKHLKPLNETLYELDESIKEDDKLFNKIAYTLLDSVTATSHLNKSQKKQKKKEQKILFKPTFKIKFMKGKGNAFKTFVTVSKEKRQIRSKKSPSPEPKSSSSPSPSPEPLSEIDVQKSLSSHGINKSLKVEIVREILRDQKDFVNEIRHVLPPKTKAAKKFIEPDLLEGDDLTPRKTKRKSVTFAEDKNVEIEPESFEPRRSLREKNTKNGREVIIETIDLTADEKRSSKRRIGKSILKTPERDASEVVDSDSSEKNGDEEGILKKKFKSLNLDDDDDEIGENGETNLSDPKIIEDEITENEQNSHEDKEQRPKKRKAGPKSKTRRSSIENSVVENGRSSFNAPIRRDSLELNRSPTKVRNSDEGESSNDEKEVEDNETENTPSPPPVKKSKPCPKSKKKITVENVFVVSPSGDISQTNEEKDSDVESNEEPDKLSEENNSLKVVNDKEESTENVNSNVDNKENSDSDEDIDEANKDSSEDESKSIFVLKGSSDEEPVNSKCSSGEENETVEETKTKKYKARPKSRQKKSDSPRSDSDNREDIPTESCEVVKPENSLSETPEMAAIIDKYVNCEPLNLQKIPENTETNRKDNLNEIDRGDPEMYLKKIDNSIIVDQCGNSEGEDADEEEECRSNSSDQNIAKILEDMFTDSPKVANNAPAGNLGLGEKEVDDLSAVLSEGLEQVNSVDT